MNNPTLFQTRWNLRALAGCNLLALGLLCFWLWPFGQILCLTFDDWLFHLLNRPLADNPIWLHMWAVASLRPFDVVVGVIMLALLIKGNWVFEATQVRRALFGFLAILLLLVVIRALFSKLTAAMGWQHNSPSMVFEDAIHLSDFFPGLEKPGN